MINVGVLDVVAAGDREVVMTRGFDAPRALVFEALTTPELLKRWLGRHEGWALETCEIDLRVGGRYRYVWREASTRAEMGVGGTYREVAPPERLVHTEKFDESWYPGEALITTVLTEEGGRTLLTMTVCFESQSARDGVLRSEMKRGVTSGYNALDQVLASKAR